MPQATETSLKADELNAQPCNESKGAQVTEPIQNSDNSGDPIQEADQELGDVEYLRDLAERIMHVPVMYGTDDSDSSRLWRISKRLKEIGWAGCS